MSSVASIMPSIYGSRRVIKARRAPRDCKYWPAQQHIIVILSPCIILSFPGGPFITADNTALFAMSEGFDTILAQF